jgi:hypothetical protein
MTACSASPLRFLILLALATGLGCTPAAPAPAPPKTCPASGKVVFRNGKPFPGGLIHFISKAEPSLAINGTIDEDGNFEVFTHFQGEALPGAVPGPFTVMISPSLKENKSVDIYQLNKQYEIKDGDNRFVFEVDPPKR